MSKKLSSHFDSSEFACPCCGVSKVATGLVEGLEFLRGMVGAHLDKNTPLRVLSGYRCAKHNTAVGGVADSQHLIGRAADIEIPKGISVEVLAELASHIDCFRLGGIGEYPKSKFVHVDVRPGRARWKG